MWDTEVYPSYGESTEESDPAPGGGGRGEGTQGGSVWIEA